MKDYMLTVITGTGARDVQVNGAETMHDAIRIVERETGCRVDHGRSGIAARFDPALIIDAATGNVYRMHDRTADESMKIANPFKGRMSFPKGK